MEDNLNLSSSSSSDLITVNSSTVSSSTTSGLITVNSSMHSAIDASDDETDEALRDLIDERKRLVAELAAAGELDIESTFPLDNSEYDQKGEFADDDGGSDNCSNNGLDGSPSIETRDADENGIDTALTVETTNADENGIDDASPMETETVDENDDEDNDSFDGNFGDEDVDKLLEESLASGTPAPGSRSSSAVDDKFSGLTQAPSVKSKVVLKHRGMEYFEVLPDGWIEVTHSSGVPVYLHKATRVCTLARPYFIGPGSVRNHDVPISAVPCYYQRKMKELEAEREKQREDASWTNRSKASDATDDGPPSCKKLKTPMVKVQTVEDFKDRNMDARQLHEYCSGVFEFETINVIRFKSWSDHRAYRRRQRQQQQMNSTTTSSAEAAARCPVRDVGTFDGSVSGRPSLPANVKLITVPDMEKGTKPQQKPFFLNPQGRTSIAVLHEYVQKVMKGSVSYEFSETRNAANPYCAVVRIATHDRQRAAASNIDGAGSVKMPSEPVWTEYGKGEGNSKKNAKLNAAKQAMRVLVPGIEFNADGIADSPQQDDAGKLFDLIRITDSRVPELSAKAGQPTPFVILQECLKRHSSFGDTTIDMNIERIKHQQHEFTMKVAKHEVKVQCTNKKEGKQRAAQAMLEKLHPQITSWGSLIRLYGYGAQRKLQETRKEKDSIIRLQVQNNKQHHFGDEPNVAILEKLKQEMHRLYEQRENTDGASATTSDAGVRAVSAVKRIDL